MIVEKGQQSFEKDGLVLSHNFLLLWRLSIDHHRWSLIVLTKILGLNLERIGLDYKIGASCSDNCENTRKLLQSPSNYLDPFGTKYFHEVFQFLAVRDLAMLDSAATNKVLRSFLHEQATAVRKLALINTMDPVGVSAIRCCIKFGVRLTGVVNYHGTVNSVSCAALCKGCDTSK